jgi:hypothetical protein
VTENETVRVRTSLSQAGPVDRLDRAFTLIRHKGLALSARAFCAGAIPALTLLAYFYFDRVEGIALLRAPLAFALIAAFMLRSWILAGVARVFVIELSPHAPVDVDGGRFLDVARTAGWVCLGLWCWSWGVLLSAGGGVIGIAFFIPFMALRGIFAPSWIARAGAVHGGGFQAIRESLGDTAHQRMTSFTVESFLLLGIFGVALNLYGIFGFVVTVGRSFLGLELALVDLFLSYRNTFTMLAIPLFAACLVEPLRAALSAQVYVDARVRADGLDLRAALEDATRTKSAPSALTTSLTALLLCVAFAAGTVHAQETDEAPPSVDAPSLASQDFEARQQAQEILSRDIFRDVEARRHDGLTDLIERVLAWFFDRDMPDVDTSASAPIPSLPLPGPVFFVVLGVLFALAVGIFLYVSRTQADSVATQAPAEVEAMPDPRERSPDAWIGEAAALAAQGRYREALRALYLATLVSLDRSAWIRFEPSLTNWQYLRQMRTGTVRNDFRQFTSTFDVKVYGGETVGEADYAACRQLAERIVQVSQRDGEGAP